MIETPTFGEILEEEFMRVRNITENELADGTGISLSRVHALLDNSGRITHEEALKLARFFGVSDEYFLNIQNDIDLRFHVENH